MFFTLLKDVIERFKIEPQNIWNMEETALTTEHNPKRVIAEKGTTSVCSMTSGERGTLVTLALAVSATGSTAPPFFIFPLVKYKSYFVEGAGPLADGAANPSGWMKAEQFEKFLKHFAKHSRPSKDSKVLLLLDNHASHLSITGLDYCKEHGIILLALPPHTTNKLQPLDRSVFGPIKKF